MNKKTFIKKYFEFLEQLGLRASTDDRAKAKEVVERLYRNYPKEPPSPAVLESLKKYAPEASDEEAHAGTTDDQHRSPMSVRESLANEPTFAGLSIATGDYDPASEE
jgi:hypothetical protein